MFQLMVCSDLTRPNVSKSPYHPLTLRPRIALQRAGLPCDGGRKNAFVRRGLRPDRRRVGGFRSDEPVGTHRIPRRNRVAYCRLGVFTRPPPTRARGDNASLQAAWVAVGRAEEYVGPSETEVDNLAYPHRRGRDEVAQKERLKREWQAAAVVLLAVPVCTPRAVTTWCFSTPYPAWGPAHPEQGMCPGEAHTNRGEQSTCMRGELRWHVSQHAPWQPL